MGSGHSNLPRIAEFRPHNIKIDRSLIAGVDRDFFKQETMKSLVILGKTIGTLVLAEGVETQAELDTWAALGAEFLQGYHFAPPKPAADLPLAALHPVLMETARRQRAKAVGAIQARHKESLNLINLALAECERLRHSAAQTFDGGLANWVGPIPQSKRPTCLMATVCRSATRTWVRASPRPGTACSRPPRGAPTKPTRSTSSARLTRVSISTSPTPRSAWPPASPAAPWP